MVVNWYVDGVVKLESCEARGSDRSRYESLVGQIARRPPMSRIWTQLYCRFVVKNESGSELLRHNFTRVSQSPRTETTPS